jgi:hypothetical protein
MTPTARNARALVADEHTHTQPQGFFPAKIEQALSPPITGDMDRPLQIFRPRHWRIMNLAQIFILLFGFLVVLAFAIVFFSPASAPRPSSDLERQGLLPEQDSQR